MNPNEVPLHLFILNENQENHQTEKSYHGRKGTERTHDGVIRDAGRDMRA